MLGRFPCRFSFADLFESALGRPMTGEESAGFRTLSQAGKNRKVKELCALTHGAFVWEDRLGRDGRWYTAFGPPRKARAGPERRSRNRSGSGSSSAAR